VIAFESIYSMDGLMAPISAICDLAQKYGALTYLDDVHAGWWVLRSNWHRVEGAAGPFVAA
jgi:selenocysteine lyase/cysteine desulfurase